jgi:hypothetical protein
MSVSRQAGADTGLQLVTNPARADGQRVGRQPEARRQRAPLLDPVPRFALIVVEDQRAISRRQLAETVVQTSHAPFVVLLDVKGAGSDVRREPRLLVFGAAQILEEHVARDDVAIARGSRIRDGSGFLEAPGHAVQRVVGKIVR